MAAQTELYTSFETSKQLFIETVRQAYEKFLIDNGVDLKGEIRKKVIDEIRAKKLKNKVKRDKKRKQELEEKRLVHLEITSNQLFTLEAKIVDKIQEYYGDLVDVDVISEWYYNDSAITMEFMWNDKKLTITSEDSDVKISGGPKKLQKKINRCIDLMVNFVDLSDVYYYLNDLYYTSSAINSE